MKENIITTLNYNSDLQLGQLKAVFSTCDLYLPNISL